MTKKTSEVLAPDATVGPAEIPGLASLGPKGRAFVAKVVAATQAAMARGEDPLTVIPKGERPPVTHPTPAELRAIETGQARMAKAAERRQRKADAKKEP